MPVFQNAGHPIAYLDEGEGDPVVLVHGFASTKEVNWVGPSWTRTLLRAGYRVIAPDDRGHGASVKFYDPAEYHTTRMADDVIALMDHCGIGQAILIGYSMGARISAFLARDNPQRVRALVLGGLGIHLISSVGLPQHVAAALEAPSLDDVTDAQGRTFRQFAEQTQSDLRALAACIRGSRQAMAEVDLAKLTMPVLVAVGTKDDVAGSAEALAALLPQGEALAIPDRDHMRSVGDRVFKDGVLDFLARLDRKA